MDALKKRFELDVKIEGHGAMEYMASLLEQNDSQKMEIERVKASVSVLKQMNNYNRSLIDAAKFQLKEWEFKSKNNVSELMES